MCYFSKVVLICRLPVHRNRNCEPCAIWHFRSQDSVISTVAMAGAGNWVLLILWCPLSMSITHYTTVSITHYTILYQQLFLSLKSIEHNNKFAANISTMLDFIVLCCCHMANMIKYLLKNARKSTRRCARFTCIDCIDCEDRRDWRDWRECRGCGGCRAADCTDCTDFTDWNHCINWRSEKVWVTYLLTDNLKARGASASKK